MNFDEYFTSGFEDNNETGNKPESASKVGFNPFCIDGLEPLPFEIDEEEAYSASSPHQYLYYAHACLASNEPGEAICWVGHGYKKFPLNPDLLAFLVVFNLKEINTLKRKEPVLYSADKTFSDRYGETLSNLNRDCEDFTIRAYVALLLYYIEINPRENKSILEELVKEMRHKFKGDLSGYLAEKLLSKYFSDEPIAEDELKLIKSALEGMRCVMSIEDAYSGYISSIMPLVEAICDELYWK